MPKLVPEPSVRGGEGDDANDQSQAMDVEADIAKTEGGDAGSSGGAESKKRPSEPQDDSSAPSAKKAKRPHDVPDGTLQQQQLAAAAVHQRMQNLPILGVGTGATPAQQQLFARQLMQASQSAPPTDAQKMMQLQLMMNAQQMLHFQQMAYAQQMMMNPGTANVTNWGTRLPKDLDIPPKMATVLQRTMALTGGKAHRVVLTLPPPNAKLGMILDDNAACALPELKGLTPASPMLAQIPPALRKDCCIALLTGEGVGRAQPKTAAACAELISKAQKGKSRPATLEVVLVETKGGGKADGRTRKRKAGPKIGEEKRAFDGLKRRALLDYFSDPTLMNTYAYCREIGKEGFRSTMEREIKKDPRLAQLEKQRHVAARRKEAYGIIEKLWPNVEEEGKAGGDRRLRQALLFFFQDAHYETFDSFCREERVGRPLRDAAKRVIDGNASLTALMTERDDPTRRKEAVDVINGLLPDASRKDAKDELEGARRQKQLLLDFFGGNASLEMFCKAKKVDAAERRAMMRFIDTEGRLAELVDRRLVLERRVEAMGIIKQAFESKLGPDSDTDSEEEQSGEDAGEKEKGKSTPKNDASAKPSMLSKRDQFFTPENMYLIAEGLDFSARPRMSRDGTKEIAIHDRKFPDEYLMLLMIDLSNRVMDGQSLSREDRTLTMTNCCKCLFYDHGYKEPAKMSSLVRTTMWETRLENAYMYGADQHPLSKLCMGQSSYTDKIEQEHPGLIARLHAQAEEYLGSDAGAAEKSMLMMELSMEEACDDPSCPVLDINAQTLRKWEMAQKLQQQPGGGKEGSGQPKTEEMSIDRIEKKHPGLILGLYNFAVEALGPDVSYHLLATCMNERAKELVEDNPNLPLVTLTKNTLPTWLKKQDLLMASLFLDEETADVLFEVGEGEDKRRYFAHYCVLKKCAPDLASMCEGCKKLESVPLPDTDPVVFHEVLRYVYGGKVAGWEGKHRDFIDAADKFGVVTLKLEAEALYLETDKFTVENVVDKLLYADAKNCALLREHAIMFIVENTAELFRSESFKNIPKTDDLMQEIFSVAALVLHKRARPFNKKARYLPIDQLRKKLAEKEVDTDGSREVLIARAQQLEPE